jgi:hypothetical protein
MVAALGRRNHKGQFRRSFTTDVSSDNGTQLRRPASKLCHYGSDQLIRGNRDMNQQATTPTCRSGYADNENSIQHIAAELAAQGEVQRPLHLPTQLLCLLLHASTSISRLMFSFLQRPLKLGIQ